MGIFYHGAAHAVASRRQLLVPWGSQQKQTSWGVITKNLEIEGVTAAGWGPLDISWFINQYNSQ